jgi:hypothetical protein
MAEIPVRRKSGVPGWMWPLGLIALLLLGALLLRGYSERNTVLDTNTDDANLTTNRNASITDNSNASADVENSNSRTTTQGVETAKGSRVTDVGIYGSTKDKLSLAGRRIDLRNVKVKRVLSDRVFTVTSGNSEMFAMLDENLDPAGSKKKQTRMRAGQTVNLGGTFQRIPSEQIKDARRRDLNARQYAQMKGQRIYLHTTEVSNAN